MQFGTDTASQVIVGVDVTNQGTDHGLMTPMIEQIYQERASTVECVNVLARQRDLVSSRGR